MINVLVANFLNATCSFRYKYSPHHLEAVYDLKYPYRNIPSLKEIFRTVLETCFSLQIARD
jgi:hypothetical protein